MVQLLDIAAPYKISDFKYIARQTDILQCTYISNYDKIPNFLNDITYRESK